MTNKSACNLVDVPAKKYMCTRYTLLYPIISACSIYVSLHHFTPVGPLPHVAHPRIYHPPLKPQSRVCLAANEMIPLVKASVLDDISSANTEEETGCYPIIT